MNAEIDESPEGGDIAYKTGQDLTRPQLFE